MSTRIQTRFSGNAPTVSSTQCRFHHFDYECLYSLFNPYLQRSKGVVTLYDPFGVKLRELPYDLAAYSSVLLDLRKGEYTSSVAETFSKGKASAHKQDLRGGEQGGTIAVTNKQGSVKNFGYLLIKEARSPRFSIEHPIHQQSGNAMTAPAPFDSAGRLKAKNILSHHWSFIQR